MSIETTFMGQPVTSDMFARSVFYKKCFNLKSDVEVLFNLHQRVRALKCSVLNLNDEIARIENIMDYMEGVIEC